MIDYQVVCPHVADYTTAAVAFWPPNATAAVIPDEPPPYVSHDVAEAWLVAGLRAARNALRDPHAADGIIDHRPGVVSLAEEDEDRAAVCINADTTTGSAQEKLGAGEICTINDGFCISNGGYFN